MEGILVIKRTIIFLVSISLSATSWAIAESKPLSFPKVIQKIDPTQKKAVLAYVASQLFFSPTTVSGESSAIRSSFTSLMQTLAMVGLSIERRNIQAISIGKDHLFFVLQNKTQLNAACELETTNSASPQASPFRAIYDLKCVDEVADTRLTSEVTQDWRGNFGIGVPTENLLDSRNGRHPAEGSFEASMNREVKTQVEKMITIVGAVRPEGTSLFQTLGFPGLTLAAAPVLIDSTTLTPFYAFEGTYQGKHLVCAAASNSSLIGCVENSSSVDFNYLALSNGSRLLEVINNL